MGSSARGMTHTSHHCDIPNCPEPSNKARLEAAVGDLRAALAGLIATVTATTGPGLHTSMMIAKATLALYPAEEPAEEEPMEHWPERAGDAQALPKG